MVLQQILHVGGTVLIHVAALIYTASVVKHTRVRWWATEMGRHLMAYMSTMATVLVLSCIVNDVGDSLWFQTVRLVAFVAVPIVGGQRLWLQIKAQRTARASIDKEVP